MNQATAYQYDAYGNRTRETHPNGLAHSYAYDKLDRPTSKSAVEGGTTTLLEEYGYPMQANGTVKETKRAYFASNAYADTASTYDFAGRLLRTDFPDGGAVVSTYLANGLLDSATDAMGNKAHYEYDPLNRRIRQWAPHSGSLYSLTAWSYDSAGRVTLESAYATPLAKGAAPSGPASTRAYA